MSDAAALRGGRRERSWFARLSSPVRSRRGSFDPLKAAVLVLLFLPAIFLASRYGQGEFGARPILKLVHGTGTWAVRLVVLALCLTPARVLLNWPASATLRRMIGVAAACYAALHLSLYAAQQNFRMLHVASEILHRFYLTIGFVALSGLLVLAATSTDATMRSMGRRWKQVHRAVYAVALLGLMHFFLQAKADVGQAVVLAGLFLWLMGWRLLPANRRTRFSSVLGLGVLATLGSAGLEIAWYGLTTGIATHRVLMANFQTAHPRPAAYVALWAVGAAVAIAGRRLWVAIGARTARPDRLEPLQTTVARKG